MQRLGMKSETSIMEAHYTKHIFTHQFQENHAFKLSSQLCVAGTKCQRQDMFDLMIGICSADAHIAFRGKLWPKRTTRSDPNPTKDLRVATKLPTIEPQFWHLTSCDLFLALPRVKPGCVLFLEISGLMIKCTSFSFL